MAKKLSYDEIRAIITKFSDVTSTSPQLTLDGRRSYAFAAGALESQLAFALVDLPAHKQKITLEILQNLTDKYSVKA
jgi:hypothetical protein